MEDSILEFKEYRLRQIEVLGIDVDEDGLLTIDTDKHRIELKISSHEQTREELDKQLSRELEETWQIGEILDYFDEKWDEIEKFVNEKVKGGKKNQ